MGIEVIKLGNEAPRVDADLRLQDLSSVSFQTFHLKNPVMSIWMMTLPGQTPIFPWWRYQSQIDDDIHALNEMYNVTSAQNLYDCLFLSQIQKLAGPHLYVIFPGFLKQERWKSLREDEKDLFSRGQACVYCLDGCYDERLTINWVPFYHPQSLVKNPDFKGMWKLFKAAKPDDTANCLTLFSLSDPKRLPLVIRFFLQEDPQRSQHLVSLVDWFGMYSSPVSPRLSTSAVFYTKKLDITSQFEQMQQQFSALFSQMKNDLVVDCRPRTVIRSLSRHIAL